jgi:hypothetical protein
MSKQRKPSDLGLLFFYVVISSRNKSAVDQHRRFQMEALSFWRYKEVDDRK